MYANMDGNNKPSSLKKLTDSTGSLINKLDKVQKSISDAKPKRTMFSGRVVKGKPTGIKNQNISPHQFGK
jgi:hypothetical protein